MVPSKASRSAEYKLIYFPLYARAEPIRMMFTHAKADWEDFAPGDKTIPWPKLKP